MKITRLNPKSSGPRWSNRMKQNMAKILMSTPKIKLVDPAVKQALKIVTDLLLNTKEGQAILNNMDTRDLERCFRTGDTPLVARHLIDNMDKLRSVPMEDGANKAILKLMAKLILQGGQ